MQERCFFLALIQMANIIAIIFLLVCLYNYLYCKHYYHCVTSVASQLQSVFHISCLKSPLKQHVLTRRYKLHSSAALALISSLSILQEKETWDVCFCRITVNKVQSDVGISAGKKTVSCESRKERFKANFTCRFTSLIV